MFSKSIILTVVSAGALLAASDPNRATNSVILNEAAVKNLNLSRT